MPDQPSQVMLPLSDAQVQLIAAAANARPTLRLLLAGAFSDDLVRLAEINAREQRLSMSLLHALMILAVASGSDSVRATEVAKQMTLSRTSVGIHLRTWVAVGVLEQHPVSRRYQLAACWQS